MATRAYLVTQVLIELGVYQSGQDLPAADYRVVDQKLPTLMKKMGKDRVYTVDDLDTYINDEAVDDIARWVAGEMAQQWGLADTELSTVKSNAADAAFLLRKQRTTGPTYAPSRNTYF